MQMLTINDKGVSVPSLDDVIEELSEGYKDIYGQDIIITPNTPDGQRIGIEAQARKDAYDTLAYAIQMHDPQYAVGKYADVIAKLTGIKRAAGKYTISPDVKITVDRNINIAAGAVFTNSGNNWILDDATSLLTGDNYVNLRSEFYGVVPLPVDAFLEPVQIIAGMKLVTATKGIISGKLGQSTASLMMDRERKLAINNTHDREGIEGSLLDLDGVFDAVVLENNTNVTDGDDVPAHSINAIVLGGTDEDIATTIQKKIIGGGCGTFGSESFVLTNYRGRNRTINFDRPTIKDIHVVVNAVRVRSGVDIDIDKIKDQVSSKDFKIGESALAGRLYCMQSDGTFYIKSITVDGGESVAVGVREKANIPRDNITVNIV